jgi:ABC-2 type transport system ATP-binding protein
MNDSGTIQNDAAMIVVDGLSKHYGEVRAVDGISFTIRRGEVVGLLGPNGAGKTTTMKMLTCYMPPSSGSATVAGHDVVDDPLTVRGTIGYLPENVPLYDEMGVYDYLDFIARVRNIPVAERAAAIRNITLRCGLESVIGKGIAELSKGYRQRLGLAQAMIHDPQVIILDEPTTGLDPNQIMEIRKMIRDLSGDKTVILSTHILQEVEAVCDRVLIIDDGKIIADGTPQQLHAEFQGAQELELTVRGATLPDFKAALDALGGVDSVSVGDGEGDTLVAQVASPKQVDLREAIFRLCVDRGWVLLEMRCTVVSLEDIFHTLTRGGAP